METVKNGCPICGNDVRGDDEFKFWCESCNILFNRADLAKSGSKCVERDKGYLYFIDKEGDISRVEMARSRSDKGPKIHEKILVLKLEKEKGYLYYLDKEGCVARTKMKRKGDKK